MVIFGASKLPQIGHGLGSAIKNFKRAAAGEDEIEVNKKKQVEGKSSKQLADGDDDEIEEAEVVSRKKAKKEA
jgi:sec-independent protein translocase protein TatA